MEGQGGPRRRADGELWRPDDESYYGANGDAASGTSESGGRWHYPANFDDAVPDGGSKKKKKRPDKKDRWARTEDAYSISEEGSGKKKKKKRTKSTAPDADSYSQANVSTEFPEDAEGGLYGGSSRRQAEPAQGGNVIDAPPGDDIFAHEF